jgi:hypothetical protein
VLAEREADFFASHLLMPESRFASAIRRLPLGLEGVMKIAESFQVSLSCAAVRCVAPEVFPCVLIKWSDEGFCWRWCSRLFWEYGYRWTVKSLDLFPAESATAQCGRKGDELNRLFESTTTAAQVFPSVPQRSFQNIVLREEAVSLGKYGHLTLFTLRAPFPAEVIRARKRELGFEMK